MTKVTLANLQLLDAVASRHASMFALLVASALILVLGTQLPVAAGQRRSFCSVDRNMNLSTWCYMQCASEDGVLYLFDLRPFRENDT